MQSQPVRKVRGKQLTTWSQLRAELQQMAARSAAQCSEIDNIFGESERSRCSESRCSQDLGSLLLQSVENMPEQAGHAPVHAALAGGEPEAG